MASEQVEAIREMAANPDRIKTVRISEQLYKRIDRYADDNSLSMSEAIREMAATYADGDLPPVKRHVRSRRVSLWVDPRLWARFRKRAQKEGITIADALERAAEETL